MPPHAQKDNSELVEAVLDPKVLPLKQQYSKKSEGVYISRSVTASAVSLKQFVGRNAKLSLEKTGFAIYDDKHPFWGKMYPLFDEVWQEGRFSEYVVDKNASLLADTKHPW